MSGAGSNSHTVAAIDGCTNIPRAAVMAQENETILELGIGAKSNFGSSTWIRQDLLALEDYKIRFIGQDSQAAFIMAPLNNDAEGDIFPQRDQQLSRQRDDGRLLQTAAIAHDTFFKPQGERRLRLVA